MWKVWLRPVKSSESKSSWELIGALNCYFCLPIALKHALLFCYNFRPSKSCPRAERSSPLFMSNTSSHKFNVVLSCGRRDIHYNRKILFSFSNSGILGHKWNHLMPASIAKQQIPCLVCFWGTLYPKGSLLVMLSLKNYIQEPNRLVTLATSQREASRNSRPLDGSTRASSLDNGLS